MMEFERYREQRKPSPFVTVMLSAAVPFALVSCGGDVDSVTDYDYKNACQSVPEIADKTQPVFTNDPITNAVELAAGLAFDFSSRITGEIPSPATGSGLTFNNLVVTDKSVQSFFITGSVPEGKRIGAFFFQIEGTDQYFAVPVDPGGNTGATGSPVTITMRGPVPLEGTSPEPDIIQNQIVADISAAAFLVDVDAEAPNVDGTIDGVDNASNWLLPSQTDLTITAENVGTGGMTATLFWNTATDIDLRLIEPDTNEIFFAAPNSVAGDGFLDFDNTSGFGPENIFFTDNIPFGRYEIRVNYFSAGGADNAPATNWSVSLSACGSIRAFSGVLAEVGETDEVFSFVFSEGCNIAEADKPLQNPSLFEEAVICDPQVLQEAGDDN